MNSEKEFPKTAKSAKDTVISVNLPLLLQPLATFAAGALIALAIFVTPSRGVSSGPVSANTTTSAATTTSAESAISLDTIRSLFNGDLIQIGEANSKLLIVEVGDPSCSYCQLAGGKYPELNKQAGGQFLLTQDGGSFVAPGLEIQKLVKEGRASYVYLYYPGGGRGDVAMQAMYCANEKGKFWEVHDFLMSQPGSEVIKTVANDVSKSADMAQGLATLVDQSFMQSCIDSAKYKDRLASDAELARQLGIQGTPGFYLNNTLFPGAISWTEMKGIADAALQ